MTNLRFLYAFFYNAFLRAKTQLMVELPLNERLFTNSGGVI